MSIWDWLSPTTGTASKLDGFRYDPVSQESIGHRLLEDYAAEVVAAKPRWNADISLKRFESGRRILDGSAEEQAAVAVAAVERALWLTRPRQPLERFGVAGLAHDDGHLALQRVPETVLKTLCRRRIGFTDEQSVRVLAILGELDPSYAIWRLPVKVVLSQIAPPSPDVPLSRDVRDGVELLHAKYDGAPQSAAVREVKLRLSELLAHGRPHASFDENERWVVALNQELRGMPGAEQARWAAIYNHLLAASAQKPSAKWLKEAARLRGEVGTQTFGERTEAILEAVQGNTGEPVLPRNADFVRGLVWTLAEWTPAADAPRLASRLADLALAMARKIPNVGMRSVKVVNTCITTLGRLPGMEPLAQLTRLRTKIKAAQPQKLITATLEEAARAQGMPLADLEELVTPTFGMDDVGLLTESFGDWSAEVRITGTDSVELRWRRADGKAQKSLPKDVERAHAEEVKELKATTKEIAKMLLPQRDRIERLMVDERVLPYVAWRERYLDHPLVGPLARRLIWHFQDAERSTLAAWHEGRLVGADDVEPDWLAGDVQVRLWHPLGFPVETVRAWREWLERRQIIQPFKQAHREIYIITDAELATATYSNRFAAHIVRQHQFAALCRARGWRVGLQGQFDGSAGTPTLELRRDGLRAEFFVEACYGDNEAFTDAGIALYASTDQVRFLNDEGPVPLADIPPLVFSETMRDVDLFVGVASIGADPTWQPTGERQDWRTYWERFAFGELTASAETRRDILARLLPRLRIADRVRIDGRFLVVRGEIRTYKIHLGSGNILMEPESRYLCIVPVPARELQGGAIWLPFEGDGLLSVVLSKAFMLAADTKITDPVILRQIRS